MLTQRRQKAAAREIPLSAGLPPLGWFRKILKHFSKPSRGSAQLGIMHLGGSRLTPQRQAILKSYSRWNALSALRSRAPLKSREDIYPLIDDIDFTQVLDSSKGVILQETFEKWHKEILDALVNATPKLANQYGWAAKIVNVYLKTYCYVGEGAGKE